MAKLGVSPIFKAFDTDGTVLASGTVETYITSTSTPKNTWSDSAESTDQAASFTLDANGEAVRYFATDVAYKLIIKDSSGTTVRTIDPYVPLANINSLSGNLDVNSNSIVSSSNRDINITPNGTGSVVLDGLNWPQADGTNGQLIKTDGAGQLSFVTVSGADLVLDTSPQLGADLDTNSNHIQFDDAHGILDSNGNEQLMFTETGSAVNYLIVNQSVSGAGVKLAAQGDDSNIDVIVQGKGTGRVKINNAYSLPVTDGSADQVLKTDGSGTVTFGDLNASQAEMEAGTSTVVAVTPSSIKYAPGASKGWISMDNAATDQASYNVASTVDNGTGDYTITWDTDFSSGDYVCLGTVEGSGDLICTLDTKAAGTINVNIIDASAGTASETGFTSVSVVALGDY